MWVEGVRTCPLENFFSNIFVDLNLVDVEPLILVPTWRNYRRGSEAIPKRLDMFLVVGNILDEAARYKFWVRNGGFYGYCPSFFQIEEEG